MHVLLNANKLNLAIHIERKDDCFVELCLRESGRLYLLILMKGVIVYIVSDVHVKCPFPV